MTKTQETTSLKPHKLLFPKLSHQTDLRPKNVAKDSHISKKIATLLKQETDVIKVTRSLQNLCQLGSIAKQRRLKIIIQRLCLPLAKYQLCDMSEYRNRFQLAMRELDPETIINNRLKSAQQSTFQVNRLSNNRLCILMCQETTQSWNLRQKM